MTTTITADNLLMGDVLVDNYSILASHPTFFQRGEGAADDIIAGNNAATFIESLILYERLLVDPLTPTQEGELYQGFSRQYLMVDEVLGLIPSDIIAYIDVPISRKLKLFSSIAHLFPRNGRDWEELLESYERPDGIWARFEPTIKEHIRYITMLNKVPEERKMYGTAYFRASGYIGKHVYYTALSHLLGIPYIPNYDRSALYKVFISSYNNPKLTRDLLSASHLRGEGASTIQASILQYFEEHVATLSNEILTSVLPWRVAQVKIPLLTNHVLSFSKDKKCSVLDAILEVRGSRNATNFRQWCARIWEAHKASKNRELLKLVRSFTDECDKWASELEARDPQKAQISLSFFGISMQTNIPDPLDKLESMPSKHLLFLRDLL